MPVAIAPVNGQARPVRGEFAFKRGNQAAVLFVDRADAAEEFVVMRDLFHSFTRDILPAQNVFEKRHHFIHRFRPAERENKNSVVIGV